MGKTCSYCNGSGYDPNRKAGICKFCGGFGFIGTYVKKTYVKKTVKKEECTNG